MEKYEEETGRKAIWRDQITKSFKKWQKGEKDYNLKKDRISLYVPEGIKDEWIRYAEENNYSTLSKLIRDSLKFFMEYSSQFFNTNKNINIDFLSQLSHDLKDPLTSLKAYIQLIIEEYGESFEENILNILTNAFNQCLNLEKIITEKLDSKRSEPVQSRHKEKIECDILLIEDDIEIVKFLKTYFTSKGYSCITATDGTEGIEKLREYIPKLVLLDIILPDINGYEIIKSIRLDEKTNSLPVFFLTAIPRAEALKKAEEFNATALISKPFNLKDFNIIYKYLNRK
ncbi:MAG: response regulator [Promethearchaeota archaeon]